MKATFGRITRPYSDLSGAFRSLVCLCSSMLIYEHEADEEINRTHIHFVATHECTTKTLKNTLQANLPLGYNKLDGNKDWSMPENNWDKDHKSITYMTKGKLEPKYNQGFTEDEIRLAKEAWRDDIYSKPEVKKANVLHKLYWDILDDKRARIKLLDIKEGVGIGEQPFARFHAVKKFWFNAVDRHPTLGFWKTPSFFRNVKTLTLTYCDAEGVDKPPAKDMWENYEE